MTKNIIHETISNILENNLDAMKTNLNQVILTKALEKLEERKQSIAHNYFVKSTPGK